MKYIKFLVISIFVLGCFFIFYKQPKKFDIVAEVQDEVIHHPLEVVGQIPSWLSGTLMRNGPVNVTIDGKSNEHKFDGLAMLHAFSFHEGSVYYTNKFLRTDAYKTVFDEGSLNYGGFASDPCRSLFKRFFTLFIPSSHTLLHNANVNVTKLASEFVALTEVPLPIKFDLDTLETLGVFDYQDQLPKEKCWESAHPHYDQNQGRIVNYLIKYGKTSHYTLYSLEGNSEERKIIAEVPIKEPAYMHSFAMTENYIILSEFPLVVKPLDLMLKNQAFIKNFTWQPERGTRFIVIDRQSGSIVCEQTTKPFFAFHHANAFEKDGVIYMDIVTYKDANIIIKDNLYVNASGINGDGNQTLFERFSISLDTGILTSEILFSKDNEFPRINEKFDGLPYHFVYLTVYHDPNDLLERGGVCKLNTTTQTSLEWSEKGCSAGEPVFVAAPDAKEEDEGVVLAVIHDHIHNDSFLLILDGQSFKELGRARAPHYTPLGLHGQYFAK